MRRVEMKERDRIRQKNCDHIVAFHIGHCYIRVSEVKSRYELEERIEDACCGGIKRLLFCPDCGLRVYEEGGKCYIDWWKSTPPTKKGG